MATERIVTGKKYRILSDVKNRIWDRISFWHKAEDCEFNDGKNAETKVGAINGITSDINGTSANIAASIKVVNSLNNSLGGFTPVIDSTGKITGYKTKRGADTVFPFNSTTIWFVSNHHSYTNNNSYVEFRQQAFNALLAYTGYCPIIDNGSFSVDTSDYKSIICNKSGTFYLMGCLTATGNVCTPYIFINGVQTSLPTPSYAGRMLYKLNVKTGDKLKFLLHNPENYVNLATWVFAL